MVARAHYFCFIAYCCFDYGWFFNRGYPFYIHFVLTRFFVMDTTDQHTTIIALMVGLNFLYFIFDAQPALWVAAALGCIALISPRLTHHIVSVWHAGAHAVGFFLSYSILTVVFFLILTPLAIISRFFVTESPLQFSKKSGGTYYILRHHRFSASDFEKPW